MERNNTKGKRYAVDAEKRYATPWLEYEKDLTQKEITFCSICTQYCGTQPHLSRIGLRSYDRCHCGGIASLYHILLQRKDNQLCKLQ